MEDKVNTYNREGAWAKFEALYITSIEIDGFNNAQRNIKIRYGVEEPVKEVETDIEKVCGEKGIHSQTEDTVEDVRKILALLCERALPEILTGKVTDSISLLSNTTKRFVFLLYREGSILDGKISRSDETILFHFTPSYRIIFGKLEKDEYEIHNGVLHEMVRAGLVYDCSWSSKKHDYYSLIVSPFAKNVWMSLPNIFSFPHIEVGEEW